MKESVEKSRFSVCRVCLAFDMRMHTMGPILLKIFEKLTKTKVNSKDRKPTTVCYICFSLLKRCVLFANMSRIAEEILNQILHTNSKITKDLVIQHSAGILTTYYPIPAVTYSYESDTHCNENIITESIVKGNFTRVSNKIERENQIVAIKENLKTELIRNNVEPETSNVLQQIIGGNQTTDIEQDDFEKIITKIVRIESNQAKINEISEPDIKQKDFITEKIDSDKLEKKENSNNETLEKTDINELIIDLKQEIENGIEDNIDNDIEDDKIEEIKQEIEEDTDCIIILSDEDNSKSNDNSTIIEDEEHEDLNEPSKKKSKSTYVCSLCKEIYETSTSLQKHMEIHTNRENVIKNIKRYQCEYCTKILSLTALANHECFRA